MKSQEATAGVHGVRLRNQIEQFHRDSLARKYYAPFNINSKNFMHVPEETEQWCDRFADFVAKASKLSDAGEHAHAAACFTLLYQLLEALDSGEEIIFAEEVGNWMIPADEKVWLKAYLTSLAAGATPEEFTAAVIPMIERDRLNSFAGRVHTSALKAANSRQKAHLQAELRRRNIRVR